MIVATISLIIGLGIGYIAFGPKNLQAPVILPNGMMHQMPDGSIMSNSGMQNLMDAMMRGLHGKTGDEFDKAFISEMIMHHQGAVEMAQAALKNAKHQEIKDLANAIITAQTKEIGMMEQWQIQWYK